MNVLNKDIKILVVDDSEYSRKVIAKILGDEGYNIVGEAANATDAIDILNNNSEINIIILDVIMPDVNGIELAKKIHKAYSECSVIMVSSLAQDHIIVEAISSGALDFIKKPFEKQTLLDSVDKVAKQHRKNT